MLPVIRPGARDVVADAARVYARVGACLCESPSQVTVDGVRAGGAIHKDEAWALGQLLDAGTTGLVYVVGASFGFSSVVLSLLMPRARVVTIDNWSEGRDVERARQLCDALAAQSDDPGPRLTFATGESPRDTAAVLAHAGGGPVAVALIDGLHTNAQLIADVDGVAPWMDERSLLLLHDVRLFDLWAGLRHVAAQGRFDTLVQLNTSTGLVAAFNRGHQPGAFAFLQEPQVVAHWHPDRADGPGTTTSFPAIGWDPAADARERRYDQTPRPTRADVPQVVVDPRAAAPAPAEPVRRSTPGPVPAWTDPRIARYVAATARDRAGEVLDAAREYRRLSAVWPAERAAMRYNLASALVRLGRPRRAGILFGGIGANAFAPVALRAGATFHLARLAVAAGRTAGARDLLRAALVLDPDHRAARDMLAALDTAARSPSGARRVPRRVAGDGPVLIYQMGKVGSTSFMLGLRAQAPHLEVHHSHALDEATLRRSEHWLANEPAVPEALASSTRRQIDEARLLRARLLGDGPRWRVLTMTREPMAHLVSVLFHHFELFSRLAGVADRPRLDRLPALHAFALQALSTWADPSRRPGAPMAHAALLLSHFWFDREIRSVLGVDVLATPRDAVRGWTRIRADRADLVVVRFEDFHWAATDAVAALCGVDRFALVAANRAEDRGSADVYTAFRERYRFPVALVDAVYASPYARHFYDDDERRLLASRWSDVD